MLIVSICIGKSMRMKIVHGQLSIRARGLNLELSLPLLPYFLYASSEGCVETAQIHNLI